MNKEISSKKGLLIVFAVTIFSVALTNFLVNEGLFVPSDGFGALAAYVVFRGFPIAVVLLLFLTAFSIVVGRGDIRRK